MTRRLFRLGELKVLFWNMDEANQEAGYNEPGEEHGFDDSPIRVIKYKGSFYLIDGHHRVARAIQDLRDEESLAVEIRGDWDEVESLTEWPWARAGYMPHDWGWFSDWLEQDYA